jgi:hypothetical protein
MKSRIRKPPATAGLLECARLLGERLGIPMPFSVVGKEITEWWAEVGKALAEQQPEFRRAARRPPGSKTKNLNPTPGRDAARKRRQRSKLTGTSEKSERPDGWVQIGDQTYLLPEKVLASIEPFLIRRDGNSS